LAVVLDSTTRKLELPTRVLPIVLLEDAKNLEATLQTALLGARKGALVLVPRVLQSDQSREAIVLESFGFSQARTLLESLCGPQPIGLVKPWFERTLGNAAILAEVSRLLNKGVFDDDELLAEIKRFVLDYFQVFSTPDSEVFSVAALFGSSFYLQGLNAVLSRDVSAELERLIEGGVVQVANVSKLPNEIEYFIPIPVLREVAVSSLIPDVKTVFHLAIAAWFANRIPVRAREHMRLAQVQPAASKRILAAALNNPKQRKTLLGKGSRVQKRKSEI
jgi:predicted ATPase